MKMIDLDKNWKLYEHEGKILLDVWCNHGFFDYSFMIALDEYEVASYESKGIQYLSKLADEIHHSAPISKTSDSKFKGRNVSARYGHLTNNALQNIRPTLKWG